MNAELRCYPCEGGFSISITATVGLRYWLEYYLIGAGGYQESGEISGVVTSRPEVVRQSVSVTVVEIGIVSMTLGEAVTSRPSSGRSHRLPVPDQRRVPVEKVEIIRRVGSETGHAPSTVK
jgi:hypothetical protein